MIFIENIGRVFPTHIIAGAGIVINEHQEILMVKTYNAGWVFPGGHIEQKGYSIFKKKGRLQWKY